MAKKFFMVLMALSLATAAFANGQNEKAPNGAFQGDKVTLKGTVSFQSFPHPVLKSGDKQYLLMVPPYLAARSGVKEGAQVTVQGYQLSDPITNAYTNTSYTGLFVTQATIDGKDYDLARYYGQMMFGGRGRGFGPGYGMMGGNGYGPGYGPGYGMMGPGYGRGYGMMGRGWGNGMMGPWDGDDR